MRYAAAALFSVWMLGASTASALPPIPNYLKQSLADKPEYKAYLDAVTAASDKCASCHTPGVKKTEKGHGLNDFGQAVHKHLDDKAFMAAHKAKNSEEALRLLNEAWGKTVEEKNADGKSYGELMKAGQLPGKND
jgi:hypothetical protein